MILDNSILEVQGIWSVMIHEKVIKNVLYVTKLSMNMLSIIQVARKGYSFKFKLDSWCIKKGLTTLVKGLVKYDLYIMDQVPIKMCLAMNDFYRGNI